MTADTVTSTVTQLLAHVDRLLAMRRREKFFGLIGAMMDKVPQLLYLRRAFRSRTGVAAGLTLLKRRYAALHDDAGRARPKPPVAL